MERSERIKDLEKDIRENLSIKEVIGTRIDVGRPLCPFHDDKNIGSFQISEGKGIWKCFSCGESGDAISFIRKYDGITREQAILKVAVEFEMISKQEYEKLSKNKFIGKTRHFVQRASSSKEAELQDEETIDIVYKQFINGNKLIGQPILSKEHRAYLNGRGITNEEIKKYRYFTIPSRKIMKPLLKRLKNQGIEGEDLIGVPGFFRRVKSGWITFVNPEGIGIPIMSEDEKILGIQIRKDKVKNKAKGSRYIWFSSAFTTNPESFNIDADGCGPGTPFDVIIPKEILRERILITEGHFKAARFVKEYGCVSISVQGVGNFTGIDKTLEKIHDKLPNIDTVVIAYDADMATNVAVRNHLLNLADIITNLEWTNLYIAQWDEKYGKGIDDVLDNHHADKVRYVSFNKFFKRLLEEA